MLKENYLAFARIKMSLDILLVSGAFLLGYLLRNLFSPFIPLNQVVWALPVFLVCWIVTLHYLGFYESLRTTKISTVLWIIFKSAILSFIIFNATIYFIKHTYLSRFFIILIFLCAILLISTVKVILMYISYSARKKGYNFKNILIIGSGKRAQNFIKVIEKHSEWGLRIIGLVDDDPEKTGHYVNGYKILGDFSHLEHIIHEKYSIDEVVFVVPRSWLNKIEGVMQFLETEGIRSHLAIDHFDLTIAKAKTTELNGCPLLTFETTPDKIWHLLFKRAMDIVICATAILLLSPLFLLIYLSIKLTSKGPAIFKQVRCGLNNHKFTLYKFRTMCIDAESKLKELMAKNQMKGPAFKMANDPRITPVGRILRKLSLDELPQLWNVLKGDMSIVGPRPPIPKEVTSYESWHRRRLSMRPGITCLWQVNGRNNITDFNDWTKLDLYYIDHWSLWLDVKIMFKTVPTVLFGVGAK